MHLSAYQLSSLCCVDWLRAACPCVEHALETQQTKQQKLNCIGISHIGCPWLLFTVCVPAQASKWCRYEDEEAEDVCEAMERMAQLFLSDSGKVEDITDEQSKRQDSESRQESITEVK